MRVLKRAPLTRHFVLPYSLSTHTELYCLLHTLSHHVIPRTSRGMTWWWGKFSLVPVQAHNSSRAHYCYSTHFPTHNRHPANKLRDNVVKPPTSSPPDNSASLSLPQPTLWPCHKPRRKFPVIYYSKQISAYQQYCQ